MAPVNSESLAILVNLAASANLWPWLISFIGQSSDISQAGDLNLLTVAILILADFDGPHDSS